MRTKATTLYPFVPSGADFERAIGFFEAIGFQVQWRHPGIAGLRFGGAYFMLQEADIKEWQENQMITFEVDDLDLYWSELRSQGLEARFPGVRLREPTQFPWGREMHLIDPGGVCWHVRQAALPEPDIAET